MHAHAVALHFWTYNFVRFHQTLGTTPAMAAGVTESILRRGQFKGGITAFGYSTISESQ